ncbi:MAG: hypothetical protein EOP49_36410 [Sphingobacteriales bacterium]|nr:MAG: hypothetical protein EOP49_36410 [Sphingobacteriales bacterium]
MKVSIEFGLSEDTMRHIDEVRATLNLIASMGIEGTGDSCTDLSKKDLISVLCQAEQKLKMALGEIVPIRS